MSRSGAPSLHLGNMPPFNKHVLSVFHMLGTREDTKPQSPGMKADREGPSEGVEVARARKPATRCYD